MRLTYGDLCPKCKRNSIRKRTELKACECSDCTLGVIEDIPDTEADDKS